MVIYKLFRTEKVQKEMFGPICVWKSVNLLLIEVGCFKLPAVITFWSQFWCQTLTVLFITHI